MYILAVLRGRDISFLTRYNFNTFPVTMGTVFTGNDKAVIDGTPLGNKSVDDVSKGSGKVTIYVSSSYVFNVDAYHF